MRKEQLREIMRKSIHISSLILPLTYRYILNYNRLLMFLILLGALIVSLVIELYRLNIPTLHKVFHRLFGLILRRHEIRDFTGATFLLFSGMLCVAFYPAEIAFLAMSFLAVGDTFAAIVGMSYGKRKFNGTKKSLEGTLGCFVSTLLFAFAFADGVRPEVYVTGALTASLAELWRVPVDDNVKLPLLSGLVMTLLNVMVV